MSFLDEVREGLESEDTFWRWTKGIDILDDDIIDERRWYSRRRQVIRQGDELVGVEFNEGATEYQEDTELEGEAYEVRHVEVTVTKYERV